MKKHLKPILYVSALVLAVIVTAVCVINIMPKPNKYKDMAEMLLKCYGWTIEPNTEIKEYIIKVNKDGDYEGSSTLYNSSTRESSEKNVLSLFESMYDIDKLHHFNVNLTNAKFDINDVFLYNLKVHEEYRDTVIRAYDCDIVTGHPKGMEIKAQICFFDDNLAVAGLFVTGYSPEIEENTDINWDKRPEADSWSLDVSKDEFKADLQKWESFFKDYT